MTGSKRLSIAVLLAAALSGACNSRDFYSEVAGVCTYQKANSGLVWARDNKNSLTPECKAALEAVLNYDEESFASAPPGFKDRVTEAFQLIIGYPLRLPPQNRVLGVAPYSIPLWHIRILEEYDNPNQSLFNYIANQIQVIRFEDRPREGHNASYGADFLSEGEMTINSRFWAAPEDDEIRLELPFRRTATIVHEARHGDTYYHTLCHGDFTCDADINGPHGMAITYFEMLLHGSGQIRPGGSPPFLNDWDVMFTGLEICSRFAAGLDRSPPEVEALIRGIKPEVDMSDAARCQYVGGSWVKDHEGLDR